MRVWTNETTTRVQQFEPGQGDVCSRPLYNVLASRVSVLTSALQESDLLFALVTVPPAPHVRHARLRKMMPGQVHCMVRMVHNGGYASCAASSSTGLLTMSAVSRREFFCMHSGGRILVLPPLSGSGSRPGPVLTTIDRTGSMAAAWTALVGGAASGLIRCTFSRGGPPHSPSGGGSAAPSQSTRA